MIIIILLSLAWFASSSLSGILEGYYYDMQPENRKHMNLHLIYVIQRAFLAIALSIYVCYHSGIIYGSIFFAALLFTFSFFHNGFYYLTRHKLNPEIYPKGFFDDSETSTAIIELGVKFRTAMAAIGILFIIGILISI